MATKHPLDVPVVRKKRTQTPKTTPAEQEDQNPTGTDQESSHDEQADPIATETEPTAIGDTAEHSTPPTCLDLFSGMGAFGASTRGFMTPKCYCDIAPPSRQALAARIAAGELHDAAIHDDVQTLVGQPAEVVVAGFPCQGYSLLGKRQGLEHAGSRLFYEVLRVVDDSGASSVFLENVPAVRKSLDVIVEELSVKRGFELRWEVVSGAEVGAPHMRRRWFCVGAKPGALLTQGVYSVLAGGYQPSDWTGTPPPRTVPRSSMAPGDQKLFDQRWALVGNSVVPDAARLALCRLFTGGAIDSLDKDEPVVWLPHEELCRTTTPSAGHMAAVAAGESEIHFIKPLKPIINKRRDLGLLLLPDALPPPAVPSPLQKTPLVTQPRPMTLWSTPRFGMVRACRVLTERSARDLTTQMVFEQGTEGRDQVLNPAFGEWMMSTTNTAHAPNTYDASAVPAPRAPRRARASAPRPRVEPATNEFETFVQNAAVRQEVYAFMQNRLGQDEMNEDMVNLVLEGLVKASKL